MCALTQRLTSGGAFRGFANSVPRIGVRHVSSFASSIVREKPVHFAVDRAEFVDVRGRAPSV